MADNGKVVLLESLLHQPAVMKILVGSLSETVAKYLGREVTVGRPAFHDNGDASSLVVGGSVKLEGPQLSLVLFMGLTEPAFQSLYEAIFSMPPDEVNAETADIASEILNVAFGAMDPKLRELGIRVKSSLPKIVVAPEITKILGGVQVPSLRLPFAAGSTSFFVEVFAELPGLNWDYK